MSYKSEKSNGNTESCLMDRLTTLVERFQLKVRSAPLAEANLVALGDNTGQPLQVVFFTKGTADQISDQHVLWSAFVAWAGQSNPFLVALPDVVKFDLSTQSEARALVQLVHSETLGNRCGSQTVINRLGEVLMVRLLRDQIERGTTQANLLAGMADPRLSRAIVSMHDHPGRIWSNADLAAEAGLSLSRFSELFTQQVGETPMAYLRRWRLILARQDVMRGDRIDAVARRYAYGSAESFTRAFRAAYGMVPTALRHSG